MSTTTNVDEELEKVKLGTAVGRNVPYGSTEADDKNMDGVDETDDDDDDDSSELSGMQTSFHLGKTKMNHSNVWTSTRITKSFANHGDEGPVAAQGKLHAIIGSQPGRARKWTLVLCRIILLPARYRSTLCTDGELRHLSTHNQGNQRCQERPVRLELLLSWRRWRAHGAHTMTLSIFASRTCWPAPAFS
jgi:hypothetical protein